MSCLLATSSYHNNPDAVYDFNVDIEDIAARDEGLKKLARLMVNVYADEMWRATSDEQIDVRILSGGLTNNIFLLTNLVNSSKVVARVYGTY